MLPSIPGLVTAMLVFVKDSANVTFSGSCRMRANTTIISELRYQDSVLLPVFLSSAEWAALMTGAKSREEVEKCNEIRR